jgi:A/G-specific adenine glycosylase
LPQVRRPLLRWYDANKRDLPWRRARDPYRVWVAEVMLQQTRIEVVVPAYRRFLRAFPTLRRLACAEEDDVLSVWSGLGYYSRARSLQRAARFLVASGRNTFPRSMEEALELPGVGPYTAAAVLSIAYDLPHAAVDGNVVRVLSRLACLPLPDAHGEPQRALAGRLLDRRRPGDWNQALMQLGQTVCLPRAPVCDACPVAQACEARRRNLTSRYPQRTVRARTERVPLTMVLVRDHEGRLLLERGAFPHLDHLWLPLVRLEGECPRPAKTRAVRGSFRHAIQRRTFEVQVCEEVLAPRALEHRARTDRGANFERRIFRPDELCRIGRSSLLTKALRLATPRCTSVIELMVCKHPDQWIWFYKRWRTRPEGEAKLYR